MDADRLYYDSNGNLASSGDVIKNKKKKKVKGNKTPGRDKSPRGSRQFSPQRVKGAAPPPGPRRQSALGTFMAYMGGRAQNGSDSEGDEGTPSPYGKQMPPADVEGSKRKMKKKLKSPKGKEAPSRSKSPRGRNGPPPPVAPKVVANDDILPTPSRGTTPKRTPIGSMPPPPGKSPYAREAPPNDVQMESPYGGILGRSPELRGEVPQPTNAVTVPAYAPVAVVDRSKIVDRSKLNINSKKYTFATSVRYDNKKEVKNENRFKYAPMAYNMGVMTGWYFVVFGLFAFGWDFRITNGDNLSANNAKFLVGNAFTGPYTVLVGFFILLWERCYGLKRTTSLDLSNGVFSYYRGIGYIALSGPTFLAYASIIAGIMGVLTGGVNILANRNKEVGDLTKLKFSYWWSYFDWEDDKGTFYLAMFFIFMNVLLFVFNFMKTEVQVEACFDLFGPDDGVANCPSKFAPYAKGFGHILNFTCGIILIPVSRAILTIAAEKINKDNTFPIRKSIELHQVIGSIIAIASFGHTIFHYLNFAFAAEITIVAFGKFAWFTGGTILVSMAFLYSGAHSTVKKQNYYTFWFSHHAYTIFFLFLVAHGPQFYQWFIIPLIIFIYEKILRHKSRLERKVYVRSVEYVPPVLNLNFSPENKDDFVFKEGQYLYYLCPQVSDYQWHPFSMSSSMGDLEKFGYVSIHIRVQDDKNSWTYLLKEYFRLIAGAANQAKEEPFYSDSFHHYDKSGKRMKGLYNGPDGKPLLRVDGPYNAPCQVYTTYKDAILVGSGIGLTPSASILRAILRYKWSKGFWPESVRFCWVVRQQEAASFTWFIELLTDLMAKVKSDRAAGAISPDHSLQINIYVTGVKEGFKGQLPRASVRPPPNAPKGPLANLAYGDRQKALVARQSYVARNRLESVRQEEPGDKKIDRHILDDDLEVTAAGGEALLDFDSQDLFMAITRPKVRSEEQYNIDFNTANAPNRLEDIFIWNGRPEWDAVFIQTKKYAMERNARQWADTGMKPDKLKKDIGVMFCGSGQIGKALSTATRKYTSKEMEFHLNQEYF